MFIQNYLGKSALVQIGVLFCFSVLLAGCGGGESSTYVPTENAAAPTAAPEPTPAPIEDTDSDGIANSLDQCLETQADIAVDSKGCELSKAIEIVGDCKLSKIQQDLIEALNDARAVSKTCGTSSIQNAVTPLTWDCQLVAAAVGHAEDMATNNFYSLNGSNGSNFNDRITAAGYTNRSAAAEIIAAGQLDAAAVVEHWVNNTDDCMSIMNPHYIEVGAAYAENNSSEFKRYWTASFGNRATR